MGGVTDWPAPPGWCAIKGERPADGGGKPAAVEPAPPAPVMDTEMVAAPVGGVEPP